MFFGGNAYEDSLAGSKMLRWFKTFNSKCAYYSYASIPIIPSNFKVSLTDHIVEEKGNISCIYEFHLFRY